MIDKQNTKNIKLENEKLTEINEKIQRNKIVSSEDLNLLWDEFLKGGVK